jgi:hypothetical protein
MNYWHLKMTHTVYVCVCVCVYMHICRGTNLNANVCDLKLLLLQSLKQTKPQHYEYSAVCSCDICFT